MLLQHLTGLACGPGFNPDQTLQAVRSCAAYADLCQEDWDWCMLFLEKGGECLGAYPRYRKLEWEETSQRYRVRESAIARLHRLNVGTITTAKATLPRNCPNRWPDESRIARMKQEH